MAMAQQGQTYPTTRIPNMLRFSTRRLRDAQRIELWEQHNESSLIGMDVKTIDGSPLLAEESNLSLATMNLAYIATNPHMIERSADRIRRSHHDMVAFYFSVYGDAYFYQREGMLRHKPGDLIVCDTSRPFARGFAGGLRELVLTMPKARFRQLTGLSEAPPARKWRFGGSAEMSVDARSLAEAVRSGLREDWRIHTPEQLEAHIGDLVGSLFDQDESYGPGGYRKAALAHISRHISDPQLSVSQVARAVGISERHLSRVFRYDGIGVARHIQELRLARALDLLADGDHLTVREVATRCGFTSHAAFTRAFKERHGFPPSETPRKA